MLFYDKGKLGWIFCVKVTPYARFVSSSLLFDKDERSICKHEGAPLFANWLNGILIIGDYS